MQSCFLFLKANNNGLTECLKYYLRKSEAVKLGYGLIKMGMYLNAERILWWQKKKQLTRARFID